MVFSVCWILFCLYLFLGFDFRQNLVVAVVIYVLSRFADLLFGFVGFLWWLAIGW